MSDANDVDYGPLANLIGEWKGNKGMDIAPEPDGTEENPYYETIVYTAGGTVTNAESQVLSLVHYRQIVRRKTTDKAFHEQTGYWVWDPRDQVIMHSFAIPRGIGILAGAKYKDSTDNNGNIILEVTAAIDNKDWGIIQSAFMQKNALTTSFNQKITVGNGKMHYTQSTMLDIYERVFEHTDENNLIKE